MLVHRRNLIGLIADGGTSGVLCVDYDCHNRSVHIACTACHESAAICPMSDLNELADIVDALGTVYIRFWMARNVLLEYEILGTVDSVDWPCLSGNC